MKCWWTKLLYSGENKNRLVYKATTFFRRRRWEEKIQEMNQLCSRKKRNTDVQICHKQETQRSMYVVEELDTCEWIISILWKLNDCRTKGKHSGENKDQWRNPLQRKADLQLRNQLLRQLKIVPSLVKIELLPGLYTIYAEVNILEPLNFRTASFCQTFEIEKGAVYSMQWNFFSWWTIETINSSRVTVAHQSQPVLIVCIGPLGGSLN